MRTPLVLDPFPLSELRPDPSEQVVRREISDIEHLRWRDLIRRFCGIDYPRERVRHLRDSLLLAMRRRAITSYDEYYQFVLRDRQGPAEILSLLDHLLNHQTSFFRHRPSFETLRGRVLPELLRQRPRPQAEPLRFWSAGCSSGQEPYSLAMICRELLVPQTHEAQLIGTDIGPRILRRAHAGIYRTFELGQLPDSYCRKYLETVETESGPAYSIRPEIRAMTWFTFTNLADPTSFPKDQFDVIFCQNVLIYFHPDDRPQVVEALCGRLKIGGFLFLGPAEVVGLRRPGIQLYSAEQVLIYRKVGDTTDSSA